MRKLHAIVLTSLVVSWLTTTHLYAAAASIDFLFADGENVVLSALDFAIDYAGVGAIGQPRGGDGPIAWDRILSPADAGSVFTVTAINTPAFAAFAAWLTNGVDGRMGFAWLDPRTDGVTRSPNKSTVFQGVPGGNGIDLQGFNVTSMDFLLTQFTLTSPGSNPNGDGQWTDIGGTAQLTFNYETVPEPSSSVLVGCGLIGAMILNWRKRRFGCWSVVVRPLGSLPRPAKPTNQPL